MLLLASCGAARVVCVRPIASSVGEIHVRFEGWLDLIQPDRASPAHAAYTLPILPFSNDFTRSYTLLQLGHNENADWTRRAHPEPSCHAASPTSYLETPVWVEMRRARSTQTYATRT